ncbi:MAG TPA: ATP-binding protein [Fimbriimonadaceae bacterium]|nr:ATP-binding protein [Fimbriimonadaceae bacterium]HRJ33273.1 ATP-binding protein [Fimbriimonadaceae bacterium]
MLIEFIVGNYRSIKTEQRLSMVASRDKSLQDHLIRTGVRVGGSPLNLLRSVLLYGPNASGKSNVCAAINAMWQMVINSATKMNEGDEIPLMDAYRLDSRSVNEPSMFEVTVLLSNEIIRYGCQITPSVVTEEWMYSRKTVAKAPEVLLFHRVGGDPNQWKFGASFRGNKETLRQSTRSNCLLLSKAAQENNNTVLPLYNWFRNQLEYIDMADSPKRHIDRAIVRSARGEIDCVSIGGIVQVADSTVFDVQAKVEEMEVPSDVREFMKIKGRELPDRIPASKVTFGRKAEGTDDLARFDMSEESNGTQRFFAIASWLVEAFREGKTVVIDELESSLHTILTQQIMDVFNDPELGAKGSQFIVATHDTNLLDVEKIRRDQIYLVEKDPTGATEIYSLWDFQPKPRVDASLESRYLAGRFGGVPILGNLKLAIAEALISHSEANG